MVVYSVSKIFLLPIILKVVSSDSTLVKFIHQIYFIVLKRFRWISGISPLELCADNSSFARSILIMIAEFIMIFVLLLDFRIDYF